MIGLRHLGAELKRRKVLRTAGLYLIGAWIVIQVADVTFARLGVPDWVNTLLIWAAIIGFPVTILLGWRYELGPEGLVLTRPRTGADDAADLSLQRSDYLILTLVVVVVSAVAYGLVARLSGTAEYAGPRAPVMQNTVAVLPFVNTSTDPEELLRGEGLNEALRDQLSQALPVIARGSSLVFRDQTVDMRQISADLGASFLVTGRITPAVVSIELIEGPTAIRLWSQQFERRAQTLLAIQQQITDEIVTRIDPGTDATTTPATLNVSAHELLLLARQLDQQVREELVVDEPKLQRAIDLYRQATALDPSSALAHSRLGALLLYASENAAAQPEIFQALTLDPNLSETHYTQALYFLRENLPGMGAALKKAIELNPNNAEALGAYAIWNWGHGDSRATSDLLHRALDADPMSLERHRQLAVFLGGTQRRDEALELARRIVQRFPNASGQRALAQLHEFIGELDVGVAWALKALESQPNDMETVWHLADLYSQMGDFETALVYEPEPGISQLFWQRRYEDLIDLAEEKIIEGPQTTEVYYLLAFAYNAKGAFEDALYILKSTGVDQIPDETHQPSDIRAWMTLSQAYEASGDLPDARKWADEMATRMQSVVDTGTGSAWYQNLHLSCALAVLGRDAESLTALERINDSLGLVWMPLLQDSYCFQRFRDEPRYMAVVANAKRRQVDLRARLPETLRAHGVIEPAQVGKIKSDVGSARAIEQ